MEDYIVKPVDKALRVLQALADEGREMSLTELCYKVAIPKTTVFRYLATLRHRGLVAYDSRSDLYRLGTRLWSLGMAAGKQSPLGRAALPVMRALRDQFNETVNLAELDGQDVYYLEMVESRRSLRMQARLGSHDPAFCTAVGKVLLAALPEEAWDRHLPTRLKARTPHTLTSPRAVREELRQTRAQGYARDQEENEDGARCIAAPVYGGDGHAHAALSVSAPAARMTHSVEQAVAAALLEAAAQLSAQLGYRQPI